MRAWQRERRRVERQARVQSAVACAVEERGAAGGKERGHDRRRARGELGLPSRHQGEHGRAGAVGAPQVKARRGGRGGRRRRERGEGGARERLVLGVKSEGQDGGGGVGGGLVRARQL